MPAVKFLPKELVRPVSDKINCLVLLANAAQSFTVPAGYTKVLFASTGSAIWVDVTKTAVIPVATITNGTSPMLNPASFSVVPALSISCISATACIVVAEFYN